MTDMHVIRWDGTYRNKLGTNSTDNSDSIKCPLISRKCKINTEWALLWMLCAQPAIALILTRDFVYGPTSFLRRGATFGEFLDYFLDWADILCQPAQKGFAGKSQPNVSYWITPKTTLDARADSEWYSILRPQIKDFSKLPRNSAIVMQILCIA